MFVISLIFTSLGSNFFYTAVVFMVFFAYLFLNGLKQKTFFMEDNLRYIKIIIILFFLTLVLMSPQGYFIIRGIIQSKQSTPSAYNIYLRPFEDLFVQSAKPLSYFLPAIVHPVFGKFTENFIGTQLYGTSVTEHTLYLGWTPLILGLIAFRRWRKKCKQLSGVNYQLPDKNECFYIGFFVFLAIVAWFFSQPPWWKIGLFKIYMPANFTYKILPMFRAYCRFGIIVMFAVSVLAGFGLKYILERYGSGNKKIIITAFFCGLVLFEFWNYPPFKVIDVSGVPEAYYWLKSKPENFVIAEYPLDIIGPNELYKLYQTKHEKKMINGAIPGTNAHSVLKSLTKLSDPNTAQVLKRMGVKYVLVHRQDYIKTGLIDQIEELGKISHNPGIKLIKTFSAQQCTDKKISCIKETGPIDIYEVFH